MFTVFWDRYFVTPYLGAEIWVTRRLVCQKAAVAPENTTISLI